MAEPVSYRVAREHLGDEITDDGVKPKQYSEGDTRLADPTVVAALVASGVLVAPKGAKMENDAENKVEPAVKNKAEPVKAPKPKETSK